MQRHIFLDTFEGLKIMEFRVLRSSLPGGGTVLGNLTVQMAVDNLFYVVNVREET